MTYPTKTKALGLPIQVHPDNYVEARFWIVFTTTVLGGMLGAFAAGKAGRGWAMIGAGMGASASGLLLGGFAAGRLLSKGPAEAA